MLAFGVGAVIVVAGTVVDLAEPWPLKVIIDGAILHRPQTGPLPHLIAGAAPGPNLWDGNQWVTPISRETLLVRSLAATIVLIGCSALFDFLSSFLMDRAGEKVVVRLRTSLFAHLQRLSLAYHEHQRVGDLVSRITVDIDRLQSMIVAIFDTLVPNVVCLLGLATAMILIDPGFGLLALAVAPLLFVVTYRYTRRIKEAARDARMADARIAMHANETLTAMQSVQAFSREDYEDSRFADHNEESLDAALESVRLRSVFTPLVDVVSLGGTLLITYVGVHRVLDGTMSLGLLLVFLTYLKSLYRPMRALSKMTYTVSRGTTSAERLDQVLQVDDRLPMPALPIVPGPLKGHIELRDVTFRYAADLDPVLEHVNFVVDPGEHVGLVGRTGVGKSTLVSLIPRFYDVQAGAVLVDGIDVRNLELTGLRRQVSLVLQEAALFHGTVLDNIRYGDPDASMERVAAVVEAAHVSEFLDRLPNGLDTVVGERGATLSGGQRQRIAIARAMLTDAAILILDEPTTGLDRQSATLVLDGLAQLARGRTTIVISHQELALRDVDRVVHIVDRRLVDSDPSPRLVADLTDGGAVGVARNSDELTKRIFSRVADGYAPNEVAAYVASLQEALHEAAQRESALVEELNLHRAVLETKFSQVDESSKDSLR
jgi:subfamily B ATP-binding cassette protein MsbA